MPTSDRLTMLQLWLTSTLLTSSLLISAQFDSHVEIASQLLESPLHVIPALIDDDDDIDLYYVETQHLRWFENLGASNFKSNTIHALVDQEFAGLMSAQILGSPTSDLISIIVDESDMGTVMIAENLDNNQFDISTSGSFDFQNSKFLLIDMDGDADLDIVLLRLGSGDIDWLENLGSGDFSSEPVNFTTVTEPIHAESADMNGDGKLDLVVLAQAIADISAEEGLSLAYFQNQGNVFSPAIEISTDIGNPNGFICEYLDDDLLADCVFSNPEATSSVPLIWNDGGDSFTQTTLNFEDLGAGEGPQFIHVCQIDNNLGLDFLFASNTGLRYSWVRNYNDRSFGNELNFVEYGQSADFSTCADLSGNGLGDIIRISTGEDILHVFYSDDLGEYSIDESLLSVADRPVGLFPVDLDGNGLKDVISVSTHDSKVQYFPQLIPFVYGVGQLISDDFPYPTGGAWADMNGDGTEDVLIWSEVTGDVSWQINLGGLNFLNTQYSDIIPGDFIGYTLGKFNSDNRTDLAMVTSDSTLKVYNFFGADFSLADLEEELEEVCDVTSGQFNDDEFTDLAVYDEILQSVVFIAGDGDGNFAEESSINIPGEQTGLRIIAANLDTLGTDDLLVYDGDGSYQVLLSSTDYSPGSVMLMPCSNVSRVSFGDYNLDGDMDMLVGCESEESGIIIGFNDGSANFTFDELYDAGPSTLVMMEDMDGDQDPDLLWFSSPSDQIRISENIALEYSSQIDLNGDGLENVLDLLLLLGEMGCEGSCLADINGDTLVNVMDLVLFLGLFQLN